VPLIECERWWIKNLISLDEATIFRFLDFFSVFNPDAIKDLKLYMGEIQPYGGSIICSGIFIKR
jgi:hypothetical protein